LLASPKLFSALGKARPLAVAVILIAATNLLPAGLGLTPVLALPIIANLGISRWIVTPSVATPEDYSRRLLTGKC
jgi:hypothetical protein